MLNATDMPSVCIGKPSTFDHTLNTMASADSSQPGIAVITGTNRGVGLGLTKALAEKGWRVTAVCRCSSEELAQLPGVEVLSGVDLSQDTCIPLLRQHFEGAAISLLISNAGLLKVDSLEALDFAAIQQQFEVNALGPLRVISALQDALAPGAKVAIITSKMGSLSETDKGAMYGYRMSKAAANMAGKILAADLAKRQVAIAMLHPGAVMTDMFDEYWSAVGKAGMAPSTHGYISVEESVAGLMQRIEEISLESTGQFRRQTGELIPW